MTVERRAEEQALDRLIVELREQGTPELDWQRIEARLMREPRPEPRSTAARWLSRLRLPAAGLVAAAAVASLVVTRRPALTSPGFGVPHVVAWVPGEPLNGDRLAIGARITCPAA